VPPLCRARPAYAAWRRARSDGEFDAVDKIDDDQHKNDAENPPAHGAGCPIPDRSEAGLFSLCRTRGGTGLRGQGRPSIRSAKGDRSSDFRLRGGLWVSFAPLGARTKVV